MQKIYELEPKEEVAVMGPEETKKCKIVPRKYTYIPDLLPNNKRIEGETVMQLNKNEIIRAMTLADVYLIGEDDSETLLNPENYYEAIEEKSNEKEETPTTRQASAQKQRAAAKPVSPSAQPSGGSTTTPNQQSQQAKTTQAPTADTTK